MKDKRPWRGKIYRVDFNGNLSLPTKSQRATIQGAPDYDVYLIHGSPGTAKTFTLALIVESILTLDRDARIILTASSDNACDEIARKLNQRQRDTVFQFGHARFLPPGVAETKMHMDPHSDLNNCYFHHLCYTALFDCAFTIRDTQII